MFDRSIQQEPERNWQGNEYTWNHEKESVAYQRNEIHTPSDTFMNRFKVALASEELVSDLRQLPT